MPTYSLDKDDTQIITYVDNGVSKDVEKLVIDGVLAWQKSPDQPADLYSGFPNTTSPHPQGPDNWNGPARVDGLWDPAYGNLFVYNGGLGFTSSSQIVNWLTTAFPYIQNTNSNGTFNSIERTKNLTWGPFTLNSEGAITNFYVKNSDGYFGNSLTNDNNQVEDEDEFKIEAGIIIGSSGTVKRVWRYVLSDSSALAVKVSGAFVELNEFIDNASTYGGDPSGEVFAKIAVRTWHHDVMSD
tara:strand:+ start:2061 stop:2783 length:723 start_codon:yes stop_codon:yes gene_type:complete